MDAYLTRLGVSEQEQLQLPTEKLPSAFNPMLQEIWSKIIIDCTETTPSLAWAKSIAKLITEATYYKIYPFTFDQTQTNEDILKQIIDGYNTLSQYISSQPFFFLQCSAINIKQNIVFIDSTFTIQKQYNILLDFDKVLDFALKESFLVQYELSHVFVKQLSDKVKLIIDATSKTFTYEITCNQLPVIADKYYVSNEELKTFILNVLCKTAVSMINTYDKSFSKFLKV